MFTMKKLFLSLALLIGSAGAFAAENLVLNENFESQNFPPQGWGRIYPEGSWSMEPSLFLLRTAHDNDT